ncbi:MAG: CHASE2 domain-containing protein [Elusimicrobiota bacterium]
MKKINWLILGTMFLLAGCSSPDVETQTHPVRDKSEDIVLVIVDDYDIEAIGRWPWRRSYIASFLNFLQTGEPRTIVLDILLSEESYESEDLILKDAIKSAGNVFLAASFRKKIMPGRRPVIYEDKYRLDSAFFQALEPVQTREALLPLEVFRAPAEGMGSIAIFPREDELFREYPLVIDYRGDVVPSLPLVAVCHYMGISPESVKSFQRGSDFSISLGEHSIPVNYAGEFLFDLPERGEGFNIYPARSIINLYNKDKEKLKNIMEDKLVFVGANASGVQDTVATEQSFYYPGVELMAGVAENLLNHISRE